jgi:hypothetical protein
MNMQHAAGNPLNFNGFFQVIATDNQGYVSAYTTQPTGCLRNTLHFHSHLPTRAHTRLRFSHALSLTFTRPLLLPPPPLRICGSRTILVRFSLTHTYPLSLTCRYTSSASVVISLVPLTVHGQVFPTEGFSGTVQEDAPTGMVVYNLSDPSQALVIQPDPESNITLVGYEWFLQPQGAVGSLAINSVTGAITVANGALLDYETARDLQFRIRGTDPNTGLTYGVLLYIQIQNVEEPPTSVVTTPASPQVIEGPRAGNNFVANLSTVDGDANATWDGGPFTYVIRCVCAAIRSILHGWMCLPLGRLCIALGRLCFPLVRSITLICQRITLVCQRIYLAHLCGSLRLALDYTWPTLFQNHAKL